MYKINFDVFFQGQRNSDKVFQTDNPMGGLWCAELGERQGPLTLDLHLLWIDKNDLLIQYLYIIDKRHVHMILYNI